jgi:hypothetical protein
MQADKCTSLVLSVHSFPCCCRLQLSAEQDGVRYNASGALQSLLDNCATPTVMAAMLQQQKQQQKQGGGMSPLQSLVAAVAAALGARYQEAWGLALPGGLRVTICSFFACLPACVCFCIQGSACVCVRVWQGGFGVEWGLFLCCTACCHPAQLHVVRTALPQHARPQPCCLWLLSADACQPRALLLALLTCLSVCVLTFC